MVRRHWSGFGLKFVLVLIGIVSLGVGPLFVIGIAFDLETPAPHTFTWWTLGGIAAVAALHFALAWAHSLRATDDRDTARALGVATSPICAIPLGLILRIGGVPFLPFL